MGDGKILPLSGKYFATATERTQSWNGIQQEITGKVQRKLAYDVTAVARIFGNNVTSSDVRVTLWVQAPNQREQYIGIAKLVLFLHFSFPYRENYHDPLEISENNVFPCVHVCMCLNIYVYILYEIILIILRYGI